jgi:hypothetical protein
MNIHESINYAVFYIENKLEEYMDTREDDKFMALYEEWREFFVEDEYKFFYTLDTFGKDYV